ncbi:MAG: rhomboid family intramembrane serine protease [Hyphomicrobiales bacterium]|nr:rhomboid family intramembrane serine protease [Hyphomicrobiales bacterium]
MRFGGGKGDAPTPFPRARRSQTISRQDDPARNGANGDSAFDSAARIVFALLGLLTIIHGLRQFLDADVDAALVRKLAFTPGNFSAFFAPNAFAHAADPMIAAAPREAAELIGAAPRWFSPLTYAFLHGSWSHLGMNAVWLLAFGVALARRFGAARFYLLFAGASIAGALAHFLAHPFGLDPVIGASAGVSGAMGAAARFAFAANGPLGPAPATRDLSSYRRPAPPLSRFWRESRAVTFLAFWFVANFIFGALAPLAMGDGAPIAWEAHIGGMIFGLLAFSLLDPAPNRLHDATA